MTGRSCSLDCKHCSRKYLDGMIPATTPADLLAVAEALAERGAKGFLLSGGADSKGRVRVAEFAGAIKEIKSSTDLRINAHIGLTSLEDIQKLVESGVDSFSVDVYGSDDTIHEVLGLDARVDDYLAVVEELKSCGARVVAPHICIGVHRGRIRGEPNAVELLKRIGPDVLILISLIPTKGTAYQGVAPPDKEMLLSVVEKARMDLPDTKLVLGCMRSKMDRSSEADLVRAGLDGIVLPATNTVERLRSDGYIVKKRSVCCSLISSSVD
ncbi:MAG: radical SAM protein [Thermoplasmata archaeon]